MVQSQIASLSELVDLRNKLAAATDQNTMLRGIRHSQENVIAEKDTQINNLTLTNEALLRQIRAQRKEIKSLRHKLGETPAVSREQAKFNAPRRDSVAPQAVSTTSLTNPLPITPSREIKRRKPEPDTSVGFTILFPRYGCHGNTATQARTRDGGVFLKDLVYNTPIHKQGDKLVNHIWVLQRIDLPECVVSLRRKLGWTFSDATPAFTTPDSNVHSVTEFPVRRELVPIIQQNEPAPKRRRFEGQEHQESRTPAPRPTPNTITSGPKLDKGEMTEPKKPHSSSTNPFRILPQNYKLHHSSSSSTLFRSTTSSFCRK